MCKLCLRDLFRYGHSGAEHCEACALLLRRHPDREDPTTVRNGRSERLPQEREVDDPFWDLDAGCFGAPGELFEPRQLPNKEVPRDIRRTAQDYCARCPILMRCRAEADAHQYLGLWGGQWRQHLRYGTYDYRVRNLIDDELEGVA